MTLCASTGPEGAASEIRGMSRAAAIAQAAGSLACPVRLLFVSHTSDFSGAEVAMLRLIQSLPAGTDVAVACPPSGPLADALDAHGIARVAIAGTDVSFRLDPRTTPRGLAALGRSGLDVVRAIRRLRPDVIHANGTRAGLLAGPAARATGTPLVVQI